MIVIADCWQRSHVWLRLPLLQETSTYHVHPVGPGRAALLHAIETVAAR